MSITVVPPVNSQYLKLFEYCKRFRILSEKLEKKLSESPTLTIQAISVSTDLIDFTNFFSSNSTEIKDTVRELEKTEDLEEDKIAAIKLDWRDVTQKVPIFNKLNGPNPPSLVELKTNISKIKKDLCTICYWSSFVIGPSRINKTIKKMNTGEYINFYHDIVEPDDFCSKTELDTLFDWLYCRPGKINGVIDFDNGIIYKTADNLLRRLGTYIVSIILITIGAAALYYSPVVAPDLFSKSVTSFALLTSYLAIILGGIIHIIIDIWKEDKSNTKKQTKGINSWFLWGHIKEMSLWKGIIMLWFGFALLIWINKIDPVTALAAGYSIDSVFDTFVGRFEKVVSTKTSALSNSTP